jgi:O-antigen/teichoic acid export membrane protein
VGGVLILGAVSGVLSARLLGPSGRGALALGFVWMGLAAQVGELGMSHALAYFSGKDEEHASILWCQALLVAAVQSLVLLPLLALTSMWLVESAEARLVVRIGMLGVPLSLLLMYQLALLRGLRAIRRHNAIRLFQALGWASVVLAFSAMDRSSSDSLMVAYLGVLLVSVLVSAAFLRNMIGSPEWRLSRLGGVMHYGAAAWVTGLGHQTNARLDQLLLGGIVTTAALGQYSTAVGLASALNVVSMGLAVVTLPSLVRKPREERASNGLRIVLTAIGIMIPAGVALFLLAPWLIPALLGPSFTPAVDMFRILVFGHVALGASHVIHEVARASGRLAYPAVVELAGSGLTVVGILLLVPSFGIKSAAYVSVAVYSLVAGALWVVVLGSPRLKGAPSPKPIYRPQELDGTASPVDPPD